tara:strand:+ start:17980 stop:18159 length:180 start_codon:yes stop_codon:yes gene_type:complete
VGSVVVRIVNDATHQMNHGGWLAAFCVPCDVVQHVQHLHPCLMDGLSVRQVFRFVDHLL